MFRAYNGLEIIDTRPEAEIAYENMRYTEELVSKRNKRNSKPHKSFAEILAALLQEANAMNINNIEANYYALFLAIVFNTSAKNALMDMGISPDNEGSRKHEWKYD